MIRDRVCPRCGAAAGEQEYCLTCGLHLWEQPELPTRADWERRSAEPPPASSPTPAGGNGRTALAEVDAAHLAGHDGDEEKRVDAALDRIAGEGEPGTQLLVERLYTGMRMEAEGVHLDDWGGEAQDELLRKAHIEAALGRARAASAVPSLAALVGAYSDDEQFNAVVRPGAAQALEEMHLPAASEALNGALAHLIAQLARDPDERRSVVAGSLAALGQRAVEPLCIALGDPAEPVRGSAAWALGEIGDPRAVPGLISALQVEQDDDARAAVLDALAHIREQEAQPSVTPDGGRLEAPPQPPEPAQVEEVVEPKMPAERRLGTPSWAGSALATVGLSVAVAAIGILTGILLGRAAVELIGGLSQRLVAFIAPAAVVALISVVLGVRAAWGARPKPKLGLQGWGLRRWLVGIAAICAGALLVPAVAEYRSCGWRIQLDDAANVSGCDFSGADLSEVDSPRADLSGANLADSDMTGAKLAGADLSDATLVGARLVGADLSDATLDAARLAGADLSDATLEGAALAGADLSGARLERAKLARADLTDANLDNARLAGADLSGANLAGALPSLELAAADLSEANLEGAELAQADLVQATLERTRLAGANLSGANMERAKLARADLSEANLAGAELARADLSGANLGGARLERTSFLDATGLSDAALARAIGVPRSALARELGERRIVVEDRSSVLSALGRACRGGRVPGAAPYPRGGYHPLAVLAATGRQGRVNRAAPAAWAPPAVRFGQLVACVGPPKRQMVEVCGPYVDQAGLPASSITRYRLVREARLVAPRSGRLVARRSFTGSEPRACRPTESTNTTEISGRGAPFRRIRSWLAGFVD